MHMQGYPFAGGQTTDLDGDEHAASGQGANLSRADRLTLAVDEVCDRRPWLLTKADSRVCDE
jgi:hypothetical protein